ncbi:MAG: hypothetical protein COR54_11090 [Elusimicrobia bacterium CG22_combo_CG10-13_8_21_14_all_63_91]|nr:MAG: hypothetical protein COR54_11090 [Elusimicrobia bacterium CG22_combo_CG10-13_8_21_14_all_63_91]
MTYSGPCSLCIPWVFAIALTISIGFIPSPSSAYCAPTYICNCTCPAVCDQTLCQGHRELRWEEENGRCYYGPCHSCTCGAYGNHGMPDFFRRFAHGIMDALPVSPASAAEPASAPDDDSPKTVQTPLGEFFIVKPSQAPDQDRSGTIGVQIAVKDKGIVIQGVAKDSPAAKAELQAGQRVLSIDGRSTRGMPLKTAAEALRGRPGTLVVLRIKAGILPWGKKVPMIRSSVSFASEAHEGEPRVRFESRPVLETDRKECPTPRSGCYLLIRGDGGRCSYVCSDE